MGGYGAIKFGLKHPEMFALAASMSGAFGAALWTEKELKIPER
jgi:S-formylglutathione hydrolase FrmB